MTAALTAVLPLAHGGDSHWYDTIMFVAPMFVIAAVLCWTGRSERKAYEAAQALEHDSPEFGDAGETLEPSAPAERQSTD